MNNLPDALIYALIFGVILLVQYVMKRFAPQQQQPAQEEPVPEFPVQELATAETFPVAPLSEIPFGRPAVPSASEIRFGRSESPSASPVQTERRFSRRALMGSRREVQDAIVIAAILGPCRAFEPHDVQ